MLDINSTQISELKKNTGSTHLKIFESGLHGGSSGPLWGVSEEPNDISHVGYQFYSNFSSENVYRVNTPMRVWEPRGPFMGVSKEPNDIRHFGINSTQISALKTNTELTHH